MMPATKNNYNSNNIKRVGGWGERENGRMCSPYDVSSPIPNGKKSVFVLTVTEYSCSSVFRNHTQKSN